MSITIKAMLDAGAHFGHQVQRWNPKMRPFVFTQNGGIHIIDLQKSLARAKHAANFVRQTAAQGGRMILVGTKQQASETIRDAAQKCGQFYVTKRWLGGMLTNFQTIQQSIGQLKKIDKMRESGEIDYYSKKERLRMQREYDKLNEFLGGIREMNSAPALMFAIDLNKERIAVTEARKLGIPVVGLADTNVDPDWVDYPIPGNDDATRSIQLFTNLITDAYMQGAREWAQRKQQRAIEQADKKTTKKEAAPRAPLDTRRSRKDGSAPRPAGAPEVVKMSRARKLVAAGTAEDIEIQTEVAQEQNKQAQAQNQQDPSQQEPNKQAQNQKDKSKQEQSKQAQSKQEQNTQAASKQEQSKQAQSKTPDAKK